VLLAYTVPSAKVPSKLGCLGAQPKSRLALAFEAPRISVIISVATSPPSSRPSQRGTRRGGAAPTSHASAGSQSATRAGSSSTTL
jgi:hypothetical protein